MQLIQIVLLVIPLLQPCLRASEEKAIISAVVAQYALGDYYKNYKVLGVEFTSFEGGLRNFNEFDVRNFKFFDSEMDSSSIGNFIKPELDEKYSLAFLKEKYNYIIVETEEFRSLEGNEVQLSIDTPVLSTDGNYALVGCYVAMPGISSKGGVLIVKKMPDHSWRVIAIYSPYFY
ncbi:hypothetical protein [Algoriphagus namhaensis]